MIKYLYQMKVKTKLAILTGILILGMIIYGYLSSVTLQKIAINGPYYKEIATAQDLIADILPPPGYIIEAFLTSFQMAIETRPEELERLILRNRELKRQYDERHNFWEQTLPPGEMKRVFINESYQPAMEFFNLWQNQFYPAIKEGEKEKAQKLLAGPMRELYNLHREKIDEVVKLATQYNQTIETTITDLGNRLQFFATISLNLTIILGILFAWLISSSITQRLNDVLSRVDSTTQEINSLMQTQTHLTSQQSVSVQTTTSAMEDLNHSFKSTELLAQESSNRAKNSLKACEEGNTLMKRQVDGLLKHKEKVLSIVQHILRLSEITKQIHNIAAVTSNLTNQTNILALNAAVQAAQVKQHSESFSVIASEIRKLADESKKFLSQIDVLAENIKTATDSTIVIAEEGSQTVESEIEIASASKQTFNTIIENQGESVNVSAQVFSNLEKQSVAVNEVLRELEITNATTGQTLEGMKRVERELKNLVSVSDEMKTIV